MVDRGRWIDFTYEDDDGDEVEARLPAAWAICPTCAGEGRYVNPAIDGHGLSHDELYNDWDEDQRRAYFEGRYDVACEAKCTDGKILVVATTCLTPAQAELAHRYELHQQWLANEDAADRRTRYLESGGAEGGWW